jgi:hypothetical protein
VLQAGQAGRRAQPRHRHTPPQHGRGEVDLLDVDQRPRQDSQLLEVLEVRPGGHLVHRRAVGEVEHRARDLAAGARPQLGDRAAAPHAASTEKRSGSCPTSRRS